MPAGATGTVGLHGPALRGELVPGTTSHCKDVSAARTGLPLKGGRHRDLSQLRAARDRAWLTG